ncbi:MAG: ABC transporter ATP-binding protein [bacterium]|nr:ABC transporter ATP-binding protein [bacterium]
MASVKLSDLGRLSFFFRYLKPYKGWVSLSLAAVPISVAATVAMPYLIVVIIDEYLSTQDLAGLKLMILFMGLSVFAGYLADGLYTYGLQRSGLKAIADLRADLFSHCLRLPRSFYDKNPVGKVLSRMTSDMEALGESLAAGVLNLIIDLVKTAVLFGFLFYLSWKLSLVVLGLLLPVYWVTNFLRKKLRQCYNESRESLAEATAYLAECLSGIKTVQLFAAEKRVLESFDNKNFRFLKAQNRSNIYDAMLYSLIEGLTSIAMAGLIWYGSGQILAGLVSIGVLVGFINTLGKIFVPIREFAQQLAMIQRALSALEHVMHLFEETPEEEEEASAQLVTKLRQFESLVFEEVSFRYAPSSEYVLRNISFALHHGQRLALVGATGSGKSTILRLIFKAYAGYEGSIRLNGVELSSIPRKALLQMTSLMQQDVYLFNESLAFNIALGQEIPPEAVEAAAQAVHAHPFITELPGGYDYQILDNGKNLSAGQAQLVSFARAMAKQSELVLLDEATSSVDSITEDRIQKATERLFKEKTVIAIAHRLSTIEFSDMILVMKQGEIVERGTHNELLAQKGYYEQLLNKLNEQETLQEDQALGA